MTSPSRSPDADPVPVILLTGVLGAGKTTLLNDELSGALPDTLVIVNEFGEVGLDHHLVEAAADTVELLENGCACCSSLGDLASTLVHIGSRRRLGALKSVRRIVVETSGIADPAPLAATLCTPLMREAGFALDAIITVADALYGATHLDDRPEARRQVAMADALILTKTDIAAPEAVGTLEAAIRRLNSAAPILRKTTGAPLLGKAIGRAARRESAAPDAALHQHGHHQHIATTTLRRSEPVPWTAFADWLSAVVSLRGDAILRVKGLVNCRETDRPVLIQGVHHWLDAPRVLGHGPGAPETGLTFITSGDGPTDFGPSLECALAGARQLRN